MATSEVEICNRALQAIGARTTIASLTEDSTEANNCSLIYEKTRDQVEGMAFWNFTTKVATLSLIKSAPGTPSNPTASYTGWTSAYPEPPWLYEYAYPSDCLQMRMMISMIYTGVIGVPIMSNTNPSSPYSDGPVAMFVASRDEDSNGNDIQCILTNQYQAIGKYTKRVTDPGMFSAQFENALVHALAAKLAIPITGSLQLQQLQYAHANDSILQARATDGNEGITVIDTQASWMTARVLDGDWGTAGYWVAPYGPLFGGVG